MNYPKPVCYQQRNIIGPTVKICRRNSSTSLPQKCRPFLAAPMLTSTGRILLGFPDAICNGMPYLHSCWINSSCWLLCIQIHATCFSWANGSASDCLLGQGHACLVFVFITLKFSLHFKCYFVLGKVVLGVDPSVAEHTTISLHHSINNR